MRDRLPSIHAFIRQYPGIAESTSSVDSGFPWWLRLQHFLNMIFMMFIIRAGIIQYASLNFPLDEGWTRFNGSQQISYI
ncbi:MAG: hypothetical protein WKF63_09875 [Thermomicrobiales bacterium]